MNNRTDNFPKLGWVLALACTPISLGACSSPDQSSGEDEGGFGTAPSLDDGGSGTEGGSGDSGDSGEDDGGFGDDFPEGGGLEAGNEGGFVDPCEEVVSSQSNQGCEFWAVDLPNIWGDELGGPAAEDQQFAVVVANTTTDTVATVTTFRGSNDEFVDEVEVPGGQTRTISLPNWSIEQHANTTDGESFRIVSDVPVTAYQFQPLDNTVEVFSNDASLLFPTHVLGVDYTAITGEGVELIVGEVVDNAGSFVSIVATEDGTQVDFFPTSPIYSGPTSVTIDRGKVATFLSNEPTNVAGSSELTGSRVAASAPVAVFSGNVAATEPYPADPTQGCCADHVEHQMLPLPSWGSEYVAGPAPYPYSSTMDDRSAFRITGAFNGTTLTYEGSQPPGAPTQIDAYESVRFETDKAFVVRSNDPAKPIALTQFLLSNQALAGSSGQWGDPAMIVLPATAQFQDLYVIAVPEGYEADFVTIYRPKGTIITLDGAPVDGSWKSAGVVSGVDYEFLHKRLSPGAHTLKSEDGSPFSIVSTGFARDVSYGYPGGSGFEIISEPPPVPIG